MYNTSLKILRLLPPELSHTITINFLKYFKVRQKNIEDSILAQHLMGLDFLLGSLRWDSADHLLKSHHQTTHREGDSLDYG